MGVRQKLYCSIALAAALWFDMFSPWTSGNGNFWFKMSVSAAILAVIAIRGTGRPDFSKIRIGRAFAALVAGAAIAFVLWGIFWIGDRLSTLMFDFAEPQIDSVYGMKEGTSPALITVLLLFLIGPSEEFFWRGYVQKKFAETSNPTTAFIVTTAIYALVHIWSFNFMLVMAALVAGGVWGLLYRLRPSLLPALVVSHALWDALVFIILPI